LQKWDRDKIIAALLDRKSRGLALNTGAVQKSDYALAGAIANHFPSHDAALRAAGIDPASVRKASPWDRSRVVAALQARRDAGLPLNVRAISRDDNPLSAAISRHFGSHAAALGAAGINLPQGRVRKWDKAGVVAALRDLQARGIAMNGRAIRKSHLALHRAARGHFGLYDAALQAAGIDPGPVPLRKGGWDCQSIIDALRERQAKGLSLSFKAIRRSQPRLCDAIRRYFDSHDAALSACGVDPATVRKWAPWDKEKVVAALRERQARGLEMHCGAVAKSDPHLGDAIRQYFDSYDESLRALGIDPASVRRARPPLDDETILRALREIAREGRISPGMVRTADRPLLGISRRRFGTFEGAVKAAGLQYFREGGSSTGGAGHWAEERILQTLRDLHKAGHDLRYRPMKTHNQPIFFAAKELFGSYVNAVREAGIDYWQMSQAQLAKERAAAKIAAGEPDA
jgi:hypothetical protein